MTEPINLKKKKKEKRERSVKGALDDLKEQILNKELLAPIPLDRFFEELGEYPQRTLRNIFQHFYDTIHHYVPEGEDEYPNDPESASMITYDCTNLFIRGTNKPYFVDRLFSNRLINLANSFKHGNMQNKIYVFSGPHGCGKSTFLENLLLKCQEFSKTQEGALYEIFWRLDIDELGGYQNLKSSARNCGSDELEDIINRREIMRRPNEKYLDVPCPNHNHPILIVPKAEREVLLERIIQDARFKEKLFTSTEYEWVFKDEPCTICSSLYRVVTSILQNSEEQNGEEKEEERPHVLDMVFAKRYIFDRRLGIGVSVFNPGDHMDRKPIRNPELQMRLNSLLKDSTAVNYTQSWLGKTNNGIICLMDIKGHNVERLKSLHSIISDGYHKVDNLEEEIKSLFFASINPEDRRIIDEEKSFRDRVVEIRIPYVLDYNTDMAIYRNKFGKEIRNKFLPGVLERFAQAIISSRIPGSSEALTKWIKNPKAYSKHCDEQMLLLKMELYTGNLPAWLSDEDKKSFSPEVRRALMKESATEGEEGISGRESELLLVDLCSVYARNGKPVTMQMVKDFFGKTKKDLEGRGSEKFLASLVDSYDHYLLQDVKESLYNYNEAQIRQDIKDYLVSVPHEFDAPRKVRNEYTGQVMEVTGQSLQYFEDRVNKGKMSDEKRREFRDRVTNKYSSKTLNTEIRVQGKDIEETEQFKELYDAYARNLKENILDPVKNNEHFRHALQDYGTEQFSVYDKRTRADVALLMRNLQGKFRYTEEGAKQVSLYVIDQKLAEKFPG